MANFTSSKSAKKMMRDYLARFDENFADDYRQAISDFRSAFVDLMFQKTSELPASQQMQLQEEVPAIVLSYKLYESTEHRQDIIDRNGLKNPLITPANQKIEVMKPNEVSS